MIHLSGCRIHCAADHAIDSVFEDVEALAKLILPNDERWQTLHDLVFGTSGLDDEAFLEGGPDDLIGNFATLQIDAPHHATTLG
ncbi:hypothetical protein X750_28450 [Mesorhizobium sp. LNJC394B00]|nr:hypothetical protein X750_28450 [Mesorhizobium sp. LNJC394B00]